jgi:hypothetical protein
MRQVWTEGESPDLVDEIRDVALRYGLPSPYSAYLVREPEVRADAGPWPVDEAWPAAPRSPATAQGAAAVHRAEEARRFRSAGSVAQLAEAVAVANDDVDDPAAGRLLAGRRFRLEDGVWTDVTSGGPAEAIRIRSYTRAWFDLRAALPELAPILAELAAVRVAGRDVDIWVGDEGMDEIAPVALMALVTRFRGRGTEP